MVNATPDELWEMLRDDVTVEFIRDRDQAIIEISKLDFDELLHFSRMPGAYQMEKARNVVNYSSYLPINLVRHLMYAELSYKRYIIHTTGEQRYERIHTHRRRLLGTDV